MTTKDNSDKPPRTGRAKDKPVTTAESKRAAAKTKKSIENDPKPAAKKKPTQPKPKPPAANKAAGKPVTKPGRKATGTAAKVESETACTKANKPVGYTKITSTTKFDADTLVGVRVKLAIGVRKFIANSFEYSQQTYAVDNEDFIRALDRSFKSYALLLPDTRLKGEYPPGQWRIFIDPTGIITRVMR